MFFYSFTIPQIFNQVLGSTGGNIVDLGLIQEQSYQDEVCYTHKPARFTTEILNSLKFLWRLPDSHGSSGIITIHDVY